MLNYCWFRSWFVIGVGLIVAAMPGLEGQEVVKTETFLTPLFTLTPGSVAERFYYNTKFPKGHIAIKSFDVEVVDEAGNNPVPLFETYLHHWAILRYYQHKDAADPNTTVSFTQLHEPNFIVAGNSGVCQKHALPQYFGTGPDSRKTSSFLPDPYGIEVGNGDEVPSGYEERWVLNIHAIDTRGVEDRLGCIECQRHLYNVTKDGAGKALEAEYKGGLRCCYDKTQCRLSPSYKVLLAEAARNLYVRYTVKWVDWDPVFVLPLKVYIFDVTDTSKPFTDTTGPPHQQHNCLVEYNVESCSPTNKPNEECNATKMVRLMFPGSSGYLIYGMAHLHIGGIGSMLYGEDGRLLCSSSPIFGEGSEVGNEEGFVVGMTTCYPQVGSVKIKKNEILTLKSKYDPSQNHTGVMGLFHIMVADKLPNSLLRMEPLKVDGQNSI